MACVTGNYRIIYEIDDGVLAGLILAVGYRREVYNLQKQR